MREHAVEQVVLRHRASRLLVPGIALLLAATPLPAWSHAKAARAEPADGAVLADAPTTLVLCFDGEVEARFATFALVGPDGSARPVEGTLRADGTCWDVALPTLGTGTWAVTWSVVSRDSHRVEGRTGFEVRPGPVPPGGG